LRAGVCSCVCAHKKEQIVGSRKRDRFKKVVKKMKKKNRKTYHF
jgi:hypothetical protein